MWKINRIGRKFIDLIEIYIPITVFVMLFFAFLLNVFFRYILKNPLNWTFELSINAFVIVGLLGACASYRTEDHVVFDLLYTKISPKGRNILRIISYIIVIIFFTIETPAAIKYLIKFRAVTPIMKIPGRLIFASFPILLISTIFRSGYRLILDIKVFKNKTYIQTYNTEEKDLLI